ARPLGVGHVARARWEELGIGAVRRGLERPGPRRAPHELALFTMVANRLAEPLSTLACAEPEVAVYRHLRTRNPCIDGAYLPTRLIIHRYMNRRAELDIKPMALYIRRHVPTNDPTATQTRS